MINESTSLAKRVPLVIGGVVLSAFSVFQVANHVTAVNAATPCVVTIFGQQYDVAPLQTGHTGGNIFTCGTDMTTVYQSMHGTDVSRIAAYLIATPTPTPTPSTTPTPTPTPTPTITPLPTPTITPDPTPAPVGAKDDDHHHETHEDDDDENEGEIHNKAPEHSQADEHRKNGESHPNKISQSNRSGESHKSSKHDD